MTTLSLTETASIEFHLADGGNPLPPAAEQPVRDWIIALIQELHGQVGAINYIFCGDTYLHAMNVEYLSHDTLTDIITFPYADFPVISGDLFISTERVLENAATHGTNATDELHRVMAHGVLHLCGQGDKTDEEAREMRRLEQWALDNRPSGIVHSGNSHSI